MSMVRYFMREQYGRTERFKTDDIFVWQEMNGQWVKVMVDIRAFNVMMKANSKMYREVSEGELMLEQL